MFWGGAASADKVNATTMSLIANPEVLAVGRESCGNHQLSNTANVTVWAAEGRADTEKYVAVFNVNDVPMTATVVVADLPGVPLAGNPLSRSPRLSASPPPALPGWP